MCWGVVGRLDDDDDDDDKRRCDGLLWNGILVVHILMYIGVYKKMSMMYM